MALQQLQKHTWSEQPVGLKARQLSFVLTSSLRRGMRSVNGIVDFTNLRQRGASWDSSLRLTQSATKYVEAQQHHAEEHLQGVHERLQNMSATPRGEAEQLVETDPARHPGRGTQLVETAGDPFQLWESILLQAW